MEECLHKLQMLQSLEISRDLPKFLGTSRDPSDPSRFLGFLKVPRIPLPFGLQKRPPKIEKSSDFGAQKSTLFFFFPAFTRAPASPPPNSWVSDTADCATFPKTVSDLGFLAATPHESHLIHFRTLLLLWILGVIFGDHFGAPLFPRAAGPTLQLLPLGRWPYTPTCQHVGV